MLGLAGERTPKSLQHVLEGALFLAILPMLDKI